MPRRPLVPFLATLLCVVALPLVWLAAFVTSGGHWLDAVTLHGFTDLSPRLDPVSEPVAHLADPAPFALFAAALVAVAIARGRLRLALVLPFILLGANVTTQILKPALADPRVSEWLAGRQVNAASWPSGHATASMVLALCLVLVAPPRLRAWAALAGAGLALAVSFSLLTFHWHYPSDVLGGYLVAGVWTGLGVTALSAAARRRPSQARGAVAASLRDLVAPLGAAIAVGAAVFGAAVLARPEELVAYAQQHTVFVLGAATIAALALTLAGGLSLALRPPRR